MKNAASKPLIPQQGEYHPCMPFIDDDPDSKATLENIRATGETVGFFEIMTAVNTRDGKNVFFAWNPLTRLYGPFYEETPEKARGMAALRSQTGIERNVPAEEMPRFLMPCAACEVPGHPERKICRECGGEIPALTHNGITLQKDGA